MAKRGRGRSRRKMTPYQKFLKLCGMSGHAKRSRFASLRRRGKIRLNPISAADKERLLAEAHLGAMPTLLGGAGDDGFGAGSRTIVAGMGRGQRSALSARHLRAVRSGPTDPTSGFWAMRGPLKATKRRGGNRLAAAHGTKAWLKKVQSVNAAINKLNLKLIAQGVSDSERRDILEKERRKLMAKRGSKAHGKARGRGGRRRLRRSKRRCSSAARRLGRCRKKGALRVRGRRIKSRKRYCSRAGKAMARFCRRKRRAKKNMWLSNPLIEIQDLKVEGMAALKSLPSFTVGLVAGLAAPAVLTKLTGIRTAGKGTPGLASLGASILAGGLAATAAKLCPNVGGLGVCGGRQHAVAAALGAAAAILVNGLQNLLGQDIISQAQAGKIPLVASSKSTKGLGFWPNQLLAANMSDFMNPTTGFDASDQLLLDQSESGGFAENSFMGDSPLHNSFSLADQFAPSISSMSDQYSPDQIMGGSGF